MKKLKINFYVALLSVILLVISGNGCNKANIGVKTVAVPDLTNLKTSEAEQLLSNEGLMFEISDSQFSDSVPIDHVISQDPAPQTIVKSGSIVKAVESNGSANVTAPDLTKKTLDEATAILKNLGLHIASINEVESGDIAGTILSQDPQANTPLASGAGIKITVSIGSFVTVPNLIGMSINDAEVAIKNTGLVIYKVVTEDGGPNAPSGVVIYQYPMPNAHVNQGSQMLLKVSK
jgi:serine/threonine-protein kinase